MIVLTFNTTRKYQHTITHVSLW